MKYGQIANGKRANALIYRCFEHICEEDQRKFVKRFREQSHDSSQVMHTLRELVLGAYLGSNDFEARYEYAVNDKTPDWCILDEGAAVVGLIEVVNFHVDIATENVIEGQLQDKGVAWVWRDERKDNVDRLYFCIKGKAPTYRVLTEELKVPYVVAVFGESQACVDMEEIRLCLLDKYTGLFAQYPELGGVLYFRENAGRFLFNYVRSPFSPLTIELPDGEFLGAA